MKKETQSVVLLFLTAFIWGLAFVSQSVGMESVGPFTFNGARFLLGFVTLLPFLRKKTLNWKDGKAGVLCGICLFFGSSCQQIGIQTTTVGKAGFITALYILFVPLLGIVLGKKPKKQLWLWVACALVGFYCLTMQENLSLSVGDVWILASALFFAIHILVIDHVGQNTNPLVLSATQFLVAGLLGWGFAFGTETVTFEGLLQGAWPILYAGVLSSGVGYTLQVVGQKHCDPTVASLILSLESVFAALAGWVLLQQGLTLKELVGCGLVFIAVLGSQLQKEKDAA